MPRKIYQQLKDVWIRKAQKPGHFADGGGLYLQIAGNAKTWIFRYVSPETKRRRDMGLGPYPDVGLKTAREEAQKLRNKLRERIDPLQERNRERKKQELERAKSRNFRQCAEAFIAAHAPGWKNPKHQRQWPSTLEAYVYPVFGDLPVNEIDTGLVTKALERIWNSKPETASRVRGRIESVLDWATARAYRQGENPARWRGHLENLLLEKTKVRRVEHHPALAYSELPSFISDLRSRHSLSARALEFLILTATRTGEVLSAKWAEIDLEAQLWTIPAERIKPTGAPYTAQ